MGTPAQRTGATYSGWWDAFSVALDNFGSPVPPIDVPMAAWDDWKNDYAAHMQTKENNILWLRDQGEQTGFTTWYSDPEASWPRIGTDQDTGLINRYAVCFVRGAEFVLGVVNTIFVPDPPLNPVDSEHLTAKCIEIAESIVTQGKQLVKDANRYGPPWEQPTTAG